MDVREVPREPFRRHPWELARFRFFRDLLDEAGALGAGQRLLDVGAGDGWFAARLADSAPGVSITCVDSAYGSQTGEPHPNVRHQKEATGSFDTVLLLDVVEHVEDDLSFVNAYKTRATKQLLVSVPAWPLLYGNHDVALRHHRRYTPAQLRDVLARAGLRVTAAGGLFHSLVAPRLALNAVDSLLATPPATPSTRWTGPELLADVVYGALRADNAVSRIASRIGVSLPGLSTWALCVL